MNKMQLQNCVNDNNDDEDDYDDEVSNEEVGDDEVKDDEVEDEVEDVVKDEVKDVVKDEVSGHDEVVDEPDVNENVVIDNEEGKVDSSKIIVPTQTKPPMNDALL